MFRPLPRSTLFPYTTLFRSTCYQDSECLAKLQCIGNRCSPICCNSNVPCASGRCGLQRSEEHTSELQSRLHLVCRLLLEKKNRPCAIGRLWIFNWTIPDCGF